MRAQSGGRWGVVACLVVLVAATASAEPKEGEVLRYKQSVRNVVAVPGGKLLASASLDGTAKVCDLEGKLVRDWTVKGGIAAVAVSPDGQTLLAGTPAGSLIAWDIETGKERFVQQTEQKNVYALAYAPDGKTFATANHNGTVTIFDARTAERLHLIEAHRGRAWVVAYAPDGKALLTAGEDGAVRTWNPTTGKELGRVLLASAQAVGATFAADGKRLATLTFDGELFVLNRDPLKSLARVETTPGQPLRFSPDGKHLVSGHEDGTVRIWDAATGRKVGDLAGHVGPVYGVTFLGPAWLATCGKDGTVRLWKVPQR